MLLDLDFLFFFFLLFDVEESEDVREDDLDRRDFLDFFFDLLLDLRLDFFFGRLSDLLLDRADLLRDLLRDLLDLLLLLLLDLLLLLLDLLRDLFDFLLLADRDLDLRLDFFLWLRLLLLPPPFFSLLLLLDLDRDDCFLLLLFLDSFSLSGGEGDLLDFASLPPDPFLSLLLGRLSLALELSLELPPPRPSFGPPLLLLAPPLAGLGEESLLPDWRLLSFPFPPPPPPNHFFSLSLYAAVSSSQKSRIFDSVLTNCFFFFFNTLWRSSSESPSDSDSDCESDPDPYL